MQQQPPPVIYGPNGERAEWNGREYIVAPSAGPQAAPMGVPGLIPMETPAQRAQAEERAYDRQRDEVRDRRLDRTEERQAEAAERAARNEERQIEAQQRAGTPESRGRLATAIGPSVLAQDSLARQEVDASGRGVNPLNRDWGAAALDSVPDFGLLSPIARAWGGQDYQDYNQSLKTVEASLLPVFSGMAVTPQEAQRFIRANQPQIGDSPETLARKARNRQTILNEAAEMLQRPIPYPEIGRYGEEGFRERASQDGPTQSRAPELRNDGSPLSVAPGSYSGEYVATFDKDGDGVAGYDEMTAAGFTWNQEAGRYDPPGYTPDQGPPPAGPQGGEPPQGPQGGADPNAGGSFNPTGGFAAFQRGALGQLPFSDELSALIGSGLTGQSYGDIRQGQEALANYDRENNAAQRNLGGIAGATAGLAAGGGAVGAGGRFAIARAGAGAPRGERLARFGARAAQNAGIGAAFSGTYAAGEAEGDVGDRLQAGGNALAIGAGAGVVAPYIPGAVGRAGRVVDDALGNAPSRMADAVGGFAGRQAGRVGNALGVPGSQDLVNRSTGNALQPLANRVADRLGPERVNALAPRAATFSENAVVPTMIDAGDDGFRGMVKAAASRNTPARQQARDFADGRAEALPTRLSMQARRVVSSDNRLVDDIVGELETARAQQARTTYAEPYAQPVQIDPETAQALSGAPGRAALTRARAAAEAFNDTAAMQEIDALAAGQAQSVSAATLDRIRQAMSGRAEKLAQNPATRAVGAGVAQRAGMVDSALDNVEGLAPARDAYRQASRQIEATQMGGRFLNANPDDFQGAMQGLSPEQLQPVRSAIARNIEISARSPGAAPGVARRLYSDPELGNMGRAAMGDDMDRLASGARAEYSAVRNASEINPRSGPPTSLNDQDAGNLMGDLGTVMRRPLSGPLQVVANRFLSRGFNDGEAQQLVEMAIDPARTDEMIALMSQRMSRREARNLARATRYQVLTSAQAGQLQSE